MIKLIIIILAITLAMIVVEEIQIMKLRKQTIEAIEKIARRVYKK